jgi:hypothetical protein
VLEQQLPVFGLLDHQVYRSVPEDVQMTVSGTEMIAQCNALHEQSRTHATFVQPAYWSGEVDE